MRFKPIGATDLASALPLLLRGFPLTDRAFWVRGLERATSVLGGSSEPLGYVLQDHNGDAGIMLVFYSRRVLESGTAVITNLSSWFVEESCRAFAPMMMKHVLRHATAATNLTPSEVVRPMLKFFGFTPWSEGLHVSHPGQTWRRFRRRAEVRALDDRSAARLPDDEARLLEDHVRLGCLSCVLVDGDDHLPFVFVRRTFKRIPCGHLIYARRRADAWRWLGNLNLFLLRRGMPLIGVDAMADDRPPFGLFAAGRQPKYLRGIDWGKRVDYAYSEIVFLHS